MLPENNRLKKEILLLNTQRCDKCMKIKFTSKLCKNCGEYNVNSIWSDKNWQPECQDYEQQEFQLKHEKTQLELENKRLKRLIKMKDKEIEMKRKVIKMLSCIRR